MVAYTTAGVALLVPPPSAHAVILYWAPGTAGLIVTLLPLPVFTYSPIIGTPKRITSYPLITALVMSSLLWTWYSTAELVTLPNKNPGTLRGSEGQGWSEVMTIYKRATDMHSVLLIEKFHGTLNCKKWLQGGENRGIIWQNLSFCNKWRHQGLSAVCCDVRKRTEVDGWSTSVSFIFLLYILVSCAIIKHGIF